MDLVCLFSATHNTPLLIAIAASSALTTQPLTPLQAKPPTPPIALSHNCRPLSITHRLLRLPGPPMEPSCLAAKNLLVSTRGSSQRSNERAYRPPMAWLQGEQCHKATRYEHSFLQPSPAQSSNGRRAKSQLTVGRLLNISAFSFP